MALSQRRVSLLDAVGGGLGAGLGASRRSPKTPPKGPPHKRVAIPVKPPVVKPVPKGGSPSRIPVTRSPAGRKAAPDVPSSLSDLSWKFSSDSRASSPVGKPAGKSEGKPAGKPEGKAGKPESKPSIRPKSSSLRKAGPLAGPAGQRAPARREVMIHNKKDAAESPEGAAAAIEPSQQQSEEQAIKDLQELVRRQQEELEEYNHALAASTAPREYPDEENNNAFLLSSALVQQVVKQDELAVQVDEAEYSGSLHVKSLRLEDQDTAPEVLEDPRLTATKTRLNQRLQHLLGDQGDVQVAEEELAPRPDPRRRSIYLTEGAPLTMTLTGPSEQLANWDPQMIAGEDVGLEDTEQQAGLVPQQDKHDEQRVPEYVNQGTCIWESNEDPEETLHSVPTQKDQYHLEIRQLLRTLNSEDDSIYGSPTINYQNKEPIYATANKRKPAMAHLYHRDDGPNSIATTVTVELRDRDARMGESPGDLDLDRGRQPGSDLSLGSSSDTTSGDDGIGEECAARRLSRRSVGGPRSPRGSTGAGARNRGRGRGRGDPRDLSMDSGIQGSSCDLDVAVDSSSASDPLEDDHDHVIPRPSRPTPIGGCESHAAPCDAPEAVPEAFKVVEELYVAGAVAPVGVAAGPGGASAGQQAAEHTMFTETHFDSAPNLSDRCAVVTAAFTSVDRIANPACSVGDLPTSGHAPNYSEGALVPSNSSIVSLPNVASPSAQQMVPDGGVSLCASVSNLLGHGQAALPSPPEPFRRSLLRHSATKRFNSADDVFRASLLRHSLPAKPPRTPSVRASVDEGLAEQPLETASAASDSPATKSFTTPVSLRSSNFTDAHQVVVAIDFGTTYSGYAFSYTRDQNANIHMMRKWEGGDPGLHNEKAPTTLLLTPEAKFHSFGFLARDTFHDLQPDQAKRWLYFDKFKMALLSQTTLTRETTLPAANGRAVPALTVLSLSLAHLRGRALSELAAADQDVCTDWSDPGAVRWVLTVPALWGPSATQLLREAAHMAGLACPDHPEALLIVLEPEAASLCCRQLRLHQLLHNDDQGLAMASLVLDPEGTRTQYMVVDCGGGTVDITVHELCGQRATLRELHKASGGACGSLGVDREFERLLSAVFGADFMSQFRRKRPAAYVELLLSFEARKRSADPDRDAPLSIFPPFAFVEAYRKFRGKEVEHAVRKFGRPGEISWSSQGMLRLSPLLMADLFRPTLDHICSQVEEVLRSPRLRGHIQYMFLVGGFSQSLMLQQRVRSQFSGRVKVVVPQGVGLTTLRGAVLYGLDPGLVVSRRSKHTIGVGVLKRFQPGEHPQDKLVRLSDGSQWCCDVLDVLVVADQPLGPGEAVTRSYTPASARQTNIIIHIYSSADTSPPKFVTDPGVSRCGTLQLTLSTPDGGGETDGGSGAVRGAGHGAGAREIVARIEFGGTELAASALDTSSGRCVRTQLDFLSTAV